MAKLINRLRTRLIATSPMKTRASEIFGCRRRKRHK